MKFVFLAAALIAAALPGCGGASPGREILLYCGAGLRPPVDEMVEVFSREQGVRVVVDYAGSEVLLSKIKLTRKGDVYLPGDSHYVDQAAAGDMVLSRRTVCYFVPTILVQRDNPARIAGLGDLLAPGVRLGLGDPATCAIGRKSKKIFEKNGIAWEEVRANLTFQSLTVNELGMQIQAGSLDAVIVWDAVAHFFEEHGDDIAIPVGKNVISTVDIAVLDFADDRDAAAAFVEFVASQRGRAIFVKHNFRIEPPEGD